MHVAIKDALIRLGETDTDYIKIVEKRVFDLGLYRPVDVDPQTPHARDELYIVAKGTGRFTCGGETRPFAPGDVFFVPAEIEHRFADFSDDFATWVLFFARGR